MIKLVSLATIPVPWISFNTSPFTFSNPKQDHAHNGPQALTYLTRWHRLWKLSPQLPSPEMMR